MSAPAKILRTSVPYAGTHPSGVRINRGNLRTKLSISVLATAIPWLAFCFNTSMFCITPSAGMPPVPSPSMTVPVVAGYSFVLFSNIASTLGEKESASENSKSPPNLSG